MKPNDHWNDMEEMCHKTPPLFSLNKKNRLKYDRRRIRDLNSRLIIFHRNREKYIAKKLTNDLKPHAGMNYIYCLVVWRCGTKSFSSFFFFSSIFMAVRSAHQNLVSNPWQFAPFFYFTFLFISFDSSLRGEKKNLISLFLASFALRLPSSVGFLIVFVAHVMRTRRAAIINLIHFLSLCSVLSLLCALPF